MATAPAAAQGHLLELQALDTTLQQIAHAFATIEERHHATQLAAELQVTRDRLVAAATESSDIAREQTRADDDVQAVRLRIERDQQRMDAGNVPAKELESLAHEITSLRRRQSELEDTELEIMERLESAQAAHARYAEQIELLQSQLDEVQAHIGARESELTSERAKVEGERVALVAQIPQDLVALYDKVRSGGGVGAALLRQKSCQGCRIALPESELASLRAAPEDSIQRCENCRCILVRTSESGL